MARQWSATPSTAVRIRSIPQKMPVYCNGHFSLYLRNIIFQMKILVNSIFFSFLFFGYNVFSQSCLDKYEITKLTISKVAKFNVSDDEIKKAISSSKRSIN